MAGNHANSSKNKAGRKLKTPQRIKDGPKTLEEASTVAEVASLSQAERYKRPPRNRSAFASPASLPVPGERAGRVETPMTGIDENASTAPPRVSHVSRTPLPIAGPSGTSVPVYEPSVLRPHKPPVLPPVLYDRGAGREERLLAEEQEVSRVEIVMLKGIRDALSISRVMGCSKSVAEARIRRVYARWEISGGSNVAKRARGEALARTLRLVLKLEEIVQETKDNRERIVALKELHALGQYVDTLRGLTSEAIAKLNMVAEDNPVAAKLLRSEKERELIAAVVSRIGKRAEGRADASRATVAPSEGEEEQEGAPSAGLLSPTERHALEAYAARHDD